MVQSRYFQMLLQYLTTALLEQQISWIVFAKNIEEQIATRLNMASGFALTRKTRLNQAGDPRNLAKVSFGHFR